MSQMNNFMENKVADYLRSQGLASLPTNWYLAPGSAATDGSFTEITGIGLTRATVARSLVNFAGTQGPGTTLASTGTSHETSNNVAISFGTPSGSATMTHVGFFDASSGGNCWIYAPVTSVSITVGDPDPVQIAIGDLTLTLGLGGASSDYFTNKLIDLIFRAQAFAMPSPVYVALYTSAPTTAGGGTEVSGGSYARVSLTPSLTSLSGTQSAGSTTASSGTSGRTSNNAAVTFPAPSADWGTAEAWGIFDASTVGNLLIHADLGALKSIPSGTTAPSFAADALGITLA